MTNNTKKQFDFWCSRRLSVIYSCYMCPLKLRGVCKNCTLIDPEGFEEFMDKKREKRWE